MREIFLDGQKFREAVNISFSSSYPTCGVGEEVIPQVGDRIWFGLSSPGLVKKLKLLGLSCETAETMDGDWSTAVLKAG